LEMFRLVLEACGVETYMTMPDGDRVPIFGGHAARVSGGHLLGGPRRGHCHHPTLGPVGQCGGGTLHTGSPTHLRRGGHTGAGPSNSAFGADGGAADGDRTEEEASAPQAGSPAQSPDDLPAVDFVQGPLRAAVVAATVGDNAARFIMNAKTRVIHLPGVDETATEKPAWAAKCGWASANFSGCRQSPGTSAMPEVLSCAGRGFGDGGGVLGLRLFHVIRRLPSLSDVRRPRLQTMSSIARCVGGRVRA